MRASSADLASKLAEAIVPTVVVDAIRRTRLATTEAGYVRGERIDGEVHPRARWSVDATEVLAPEATDYDTLEDYLDALVLTYLAADDPAFTGTMTGDSLTLTGTLTVVTEVVTGHLNAGNSASDELRVYNLIGQGSAPAFANGAALGTSPGAQSITGHDISGIIIQNTGTSTTTGVLWSVTFASAKSSSTYRVHLAPHGTNSADCRLYVTNRTSGGFDVGCRVAPTASTQIAVGWFVFGP